MPGSESVEEQQQPSCVQHSSGRSSLPEKSRAFDPKELLSRIWLQNLPIMRERIASLETASQEALHGDLTSIRRTEASDIAHKLAGSLGMFGYPAGTEIARELEQVLEAEGPVDPVRFARLAGRLRAVLPL